MIKAENQVERGKNTQSSGKSRKQAADPAENLIAVLSQRVVGQPAATRVIVPYIQMYQAGLAPEGRPVGEDVLRVAVLAVRAVGEHQLRSQLLHHPYRNLSEHLRTIDRYTTIMAEGLFTRGVRAHSADLVLRPALRFFRAYVLKLGFLEGWRGFLQACLAAHYGGMKYAKLYALQRGEETRRRPA
jgi:hypothetical protein